MCVCLQKKVGTGGFGYVKKAVWTDRGKRMYVAVKCFYEDKAEARGGFIEEVLCRIVGTPQKPPLSLSLSTAPRADPLAAT